MANNRDISVSEFFSRNKHLLGFSSLSRSLLIGVKESVDNSLDSCDEKKVLPEVYVDIEDLGDSKFRMTVEDNGTGIKKVDIKNIFGRLLYGSKFHSLKSTRGQQGLGISMVALYSYSTTGVPIKVVTKTKKGDADYVELYLEKSTNRPKIVTEKKVKWPGPSGTKITIEMEANYQKGAYSVEEYLRQTSMMNPHVSIYYSDPFNNTYNFNRVVSSLPKSPIEMQPHPQGISLGDFMDLMDFSNQKTIKSFLTKEFCSVSSSGAKNIINKSGLKSRNNPKKLGRKKKENLYNTIKSYTLPGPPIDSISPIGEDQIILGLKNHIDANFYASTTRNPAVCNSMPFVIEAAIAYGGDISGAEVLRFANRVPLMYQKGSCIMHKCVKDLSWSHYKLNHNEGYMPSEPMCVLIHISGPALPFSNEAKEAVADYPSIEKEIILTLQELGRKLKTYKVKELRIKEERRKKKHISHFIPYLTEGIGDIIGLSKKKRSKLDKDLISILEKTRTKI